LIYSLETNFSIKLFSFKKAEAGNFKVFPENSELLPKGKYHVAVIGLKKDGIYLLVDSELTITSDGYSKIMQKYQDFPDLMQKISAAQHCANTEENLSDSWWLFRYLPPKLSEDKNFRFILAFPAGKYFLLHYAFEEKSRKVKSFLQKYNSNDNGTIKICSFCTVLKPYEILPDEIWKVGVIVFFKNSLPLPLFEAEIKIP